MFSSQRQIGAREERKRGTKERGASSRSWQGLCDRMGTDEASGGTCNFP